MGSEQQNLEKSLKVFETAHADYNATKKGRFNPIRKGVASNGSSANYHIRSPFEFYRLIEDSYDLERNDAVVGPLLNRRTGNVVQDGFRFEPNTGDKGLNQELKAMWREWASDPEQCDVAGEFTFHDYELSVDWTHVLAGDCGVSLTESGHLQFFEPYLIRHSLTAGWSENVIHGVELDDVQRRVRYWVAEDDNNPYSITFNNFTPIETRDAMGRRQFFHVYDERRMSQTRGVSAFAPIFILTGMLEDVNFSKLVQQQIVSCIAYLIEESENTGGLPGPSGNTDYGHETQETSTSGKTQLFDKMEPGMEVNPGAGRKVTGFSPQVPNAEFFQQYRLILQLICGNLDLPLSVGMMDSSETNFHGFIGAENEAKKAWRKSQKNLDDRFHTPLTIGKLTQWADEDPALKRMQTKLGRDYYRFEWRKPVWTSVKKLEDTNERLLRLRNAITSPTQIHNEIDSDFPTHVEETVRDNSLAIRTAKLEAMKINADPELQDGAPIHWSQLYPMANAEGVQTSKQALEEETTEQEPDEELGKPEPSFLREEVLRN